MKKLLYVLLTVALVVGFAFALVACDKTENFTADNSEVYSIAYTSRNQSSRRTVITSTADGVTTVSTVTVTVDTNHSTTSALAWQTETTAADGTVTTTYLLAGYYTSSSYVNATATYVGGVLSTRAFNTSSATIISTLLTNSGSNLALLSLCDYTSTNTSYDTTISGVRYSSGSTVTSTVYTVEYDNEAGDSGTMVVTVANGLVSSIDWTQSDGTSVMYEFSYGYSNLVLPSRTSDWNNDPLAAWEAAFAG